MQNLTIQLGSAHLCSFSGRPTRAHHCAAAHLSAPGPHDAAPRRVALPRPDPPSPSLFPSLPRRRPAVFKPRPRHHLLLCHPLLSGPPLERHTSPHRSPRPDHRLRPPEAPPSLEFWPSTATIRHSPVSSFPSLQSS
jgi:hypothetical protein